MEENIVVIRHFDDWVLIPDEIINDRRLSPGALGFACKMLAIPDDFEMSVGQLAESFKLSKTEAQEYTDELKRCGYIDESGELKIRRG